MKVNRAIIVTVINQVALAAAASSTFDFFGLTFPSDFGSPTTSSTPTTTSTNDNAGGFWNSFFNAGSTETTEDDSDTTSQTRDVFSDLQQYASGNDDSKDTTSSSIDFLAMLSENYVSATSEISETADSISSETDVFGLLASEIGNLSESDIFGSETDDAETESETDEAEESETQTEASTTSADFDDLLSNLGSMLGVDTRQFSATTPKITTRDSTSTNTRDSASTSGSGSGSGSGLNDDESSSEDSAQKLFGPIMGAVAVMLVSLV